MDKDEQLEKEDPREILDLKAREISLVDRPAILRTFLIIKRQEEDDSMGAFDSADVGVDTPDNVIEGMNWREYEDVEKALPIDLRNAIQELLPYLKKMGGGEGAPSKAIARVAAFLGKVAGGKYPDPTTKERTPLTQRPPRKGESDMEKGKAMDTCPECSAKMKDGICPNCGYKAKQTPEEDEEKGKGKDQGVKKSDDGFSIRISPEGGIELTGNPVAKGLKGFTAERSKALADVVKSMLSMLADVDPDVAKSIITDLTKGALPGDVKWTAGTVALSPKVTKDIEGTVSEALQPVLKQIGDLAAKVDEVTKSRPAPQASGNNETDVQKKTGKAFWSGVPL